MAKSKWVATDYPGIYKYELKSGTKYGIRVRYQDANFKWREKSESGFDTIKQARKRKTDLENSVNKNLASTFDGDKITFGEWYKQYYEMVSPTWTIDSKVTLKTIYRKHLSEFNPVSLTKITLSRYQNFINKKLHEEDLTLKYVKLIHGTMMAVINEAVKHDILIKNKLNRVTIQKQKQQEQKVKHVDLEDLQKLDEMAKTELNTLQYGMYVLMRIGWRRGEVLGLTKQAVTAIDEDVVDVTVLQTRTRSSEVSTPKTKSSYRTNRLTGDSAMAILRALEKAESIHKSNHVIFSHESRVFVNSKCKSYSPAYPQIILDQISKPIDISLTPHMLRHSFASQAITNGMSPVEVARWLGHTKIDMTLNTYSHSTNQGQEELINFASFN